MGKNILITGAAGFIGGSIVADFISRTSGPIKSANIFAAVRTDEQLRALSKLVGLHVILINLSDETAVIETILKHEIDIVVHTASSMDTPLASNLVKALGERRKVNGGETYLIHSSVTTMFTKDGGWPYEKTSDVVPLFETEKQIERGNPVRETNISLIEQAKETGVTSFIIPLPQVYGRGGGQWRQISVFLPAQIRASIKNKVVYKFDIDSVQDATHISDVVALYALLVTNILEATPIPSGENGYYFAIAHKTHMWEVMQRLAEALHTRGLVAEPNAQIWPSDEMAAEHLGFPLKFVRVIGTYSGNFVAENGQRLGWQPKWDEKRYLESLDDEILAVHELDNVKPTAFSTLGVVSK